jgi:hypothetical protein
MTDERLSKIEMKQERLEDTVNRLVLQIDKLVAAFDRTYEADHKLDMTMQLQNSKLESSQDALKRAHERCDVLDKRVVPLEHFRTQVLTYGAVVTLVVSPLVGIISHKLLGG